MTHHDSADESRLLLSAMLDGELERDRARFLIRRLQADAELSGCWQRWHIAGDCLRGHAVAPLRRDFVERIRIALQDESRPARGHGGTLLRWSGGIAVAASVAFAALLAVDPGANPVPSAAPFLAQQPAAEVAPSPYREQDLRPPMRLDALPVAATDASPFAASVRLDPRIERYLVRHNEATAGYGFVPYATLVTPLAERGTVAEPSR